MPNLTNPSKRQAPYKNNAILLKTDGTLEVLTVNSLHEIRPLINCEYPELTGFGSYPISDARGQEDVLIPFMSFTITRGQTQPEQKEYKFHRIDDMRKIQLFVHETGQILKLPHNPFFKGALRGEVVMLGHCVDELAYE